MSDDEIKNVKPDLKSIKAELIRAVTDAEPEPKKVEKNDMIDNMLSDYFSRLSRMPKELTLEALTNGLLPGGRNREESKKRIKQILDKYLP